MKTKITLILIILLFSLKGFSQDNENKWAITFGSGLVTYAEEDASAMNGKYIAQFPRLSVATYIFENVTLVGSISTDFNDDLQNYTTFDGELRYDFGTSKNRISPYVLAGGSIIDGVLTLPTLNIGAGATLWISDHVGLNGQIMYKYNAGGFRSQLTHTFLSGGIVYRFSSTGNKGGRETERKRLWERKH